MPIIPSGRWNSTGLKLKFHNTLHYDAVGLRFELLSSCVKWLVHPNHLFATPFNLWNSKREILKMGW